MRTVDSMPLGRILGHSERSCVMPRRGPPNRKLTITAGGGLASALQVRIGDQLDRRLEGDFSRMRLAIGLSPHDDWCDRKSVVLGKSVSVRVDLGGRRIITNNKN